MQRKTRLPATMRSTVAAFPHATPPHLAHISASLQESPRGRTQALALLPLRFLPGMALAPGVEDAGDCVRKFGRPVRSRPTSTMTD